MRERERWAGLKCDLVTHFFLQRRSGLESLLRRFPCSILLVCAGAQTKRPLARL